ncbi:MAG: hypothetical protein GC160_18270 [Acidobacteria bacterium]|nr:hypothetical protein [Acidobacteriota bacterium]
MPKRVIIKGPPPTTEAVAKALGLTKKEADEGRKWADQAARRYLQSVLGSKSERARRGPAAPSEGSRSTSAPASKHGSA